MVTLSKVVDNLNTIAEIKNYEVEGIRDIYVKAYNLQIHNYFNKLEIVDMENAMQSSKYCKVYTFFAKSRNENWLDYFQFQQIDEIINNCRTGKYINNTTFEKAGIAYTEKQKAAEEVFSPFLTYKKQNVYLADITNRVLAKAILAGQVEKIKSKGKNLNLLEFACDCFDDKHGFWCYIKENKQLRAGWYDRYVCDVFLK